MRCLLIFLLSCLVLPALGQQVVEKEKLIQFSGIIKDVDSNTFVPYVTVTNLTQAGERYAANYKGFFSFIAHPGDTVVFSAVGYSESQFIIPADVVESSYTAMIKLKAEIINLPTVRIFPWATVEDFTREFMTMRIADDDYAIAAKNLSRENLRGMIQNLPRDAGEISSMNFRLNHDRALNKNMVQTNPLLNPFAWGKLVQSIMKGDKSREAEN